MEIKFPVDSDFGKYFLYNLYLRSLSTKTQDDKIQLDNSNKFNKCLNLNRLALKGFNCGQRKRLLDNYFTSNSENFSEFKEKVGESCNSQISRYLSSYYNKESTYVEASLYDRVSNETISESNLLEIKNCLNLDDNLVLY